MKIGLIAMSGIRACDAELLRMGLTLPGFVERSRQIASLPSLGLLTLGGMTPPRHTQEYVEVADLAAAREAGAVPAGYDLAAISSFSAQIGEAYALADQLRAEGTKVVLGGLHVTARPQEAALHADAVVIGEGESVWCQLLQDAEAGRLEQFYDGKGGFDLAAAPLPAYELLEIGKYNRLTVQTSRGCPWRCDFCASSVLISPCYKQKPAAAVLAEVDRICAMWARPFLEFADDNTFVDRGYWHDLLPELARRGVRWFTETDVSVARDEELLRLMREAGCAQVLIGLESPTREALDGLEGNVNWKWRRWGEYRQAIAAIQEHGISVNGCFVVGLDGHGPEVFDQIFEFVRESGLHEVQVTLPTPFPGTPLYKRLEAEGRLLEPEAWEKCTLFDVNFTPARMSAKELAEGFRGLVKRLYGENFTRERRERFRGALRRSRRAGRALEHLHQIEQETVQA